MSKLQLNEKELEILKNMNLEGLSLRHQTEAFFACTTAAKDFSQQIMIPLTQGLLSPSAKEIYIRGIFWRMHGWIDTLAMLNSLKHLQAVASATRTLFELSMDLRLLLDDETGEQVARLKAFTRVERFRVAELLVCFYEANPAMRDKAAFTPQVLVDKKGERDVVLTLIERFWTQKGSKKKDRKAKDTVWPEHWTGQKVATRAKMLGPKFQKFYREYYPLLSWHMHSGLVGYAGLSAEVLEASFALYHRHSQKIFLDSIVICADALGLTKAIDSIAMDTLRNLVDDLENMPGKVLVEEQLKQLRSLSNPQDSLNSPTTAQ